MILVETGENEQLPKSGSRQKLVGRHRENHSFKLSIFTHGCRQGLTECDTGLGVGKLGAGASSATHHVALSKSFLPGAWFPCW